MRLIRGPCVVQWQEMSLRSNSAASTAIESPVPGFLSMLRMGQTDGQFRQPGEPHQETYPFHLPGQPRVIGDAPVYTPDTKLGGRPDRGGSSEGAGGSEGAPGSAGNASQYTASHEQAESQEQTNGKGRRSKEDVQKRNKEVRSEESNSSMRNLHRCTCMHAMLTLVVTGRLVHSAVHPGCRVCSGSVVHGEA